MGSAVVARVTVPGGLAALMGLNKLVAVSKQRPENPAVRRKDQNPLT
jgi:hypothetical protein